MDTRLLEDALILIEERNLTAAAARRNMTQPAFSRRIRALENWIGHALLERRANRVELSPALAESEQQIRGLLSHLRQLHGHLRDTKQGGEPLILVSQHSLSASVVPEIIAKSHTEDARLKLRIRTQNQDTAMSIFLRHEADLLVSYEYRMLPQVPFDDTVSKTVWRRDALIPVVGGHLRHQLLDGNFLSKETPYITYPNESFFGRIVSMHERGVSKLLGETPIIESAFSAGVARLVTLGVGAAWLPHSLVHDLIISGDIVILASEYGRIPMDVVLYAHSENVRANQFLELIGT